MVDTNLSMFSSPIQPVDFLVCFIFFIEFQSVDCGWRRCMYIWQSLHSWLEKLGLAAFLKLGISDDTAPRSSETWGKNGYFWNMDAYRYDSNLLIVLFYSTCWAIISVHLPACPWTHAYWNLKALPELPLDAKCRARNSLNILVVATRQWPRSHSTTHTARADE